MKRVLLFLVLVLFSPIGIACEMSQKSSEGRAANRSEQSAPFGARFLTALSKEEFWNLPVRRVAINTIEKKVVKPPEGAVEVTFRHWNLAVPAHFTRIYASDAETPGGICFVGPELKFIAIDGTDADVFRVSLLENEFFQARVETALMATGLSRADASTLVKESVLALGALPGERLFKMAMESDTDRLSKSDDARACIATGILLDIRSLRDPLGGVVHWLDGGRHMYMWQERPVGGDSDRYCRYYLIAYGAQDQSALLVCNIMLGKERFGNGNHYSLIMSCFRGNENDQEK